MTWVFVSVGAALILLAYWRGPNAVWGTTTFGALVGVVIANVRPGFDWSTVAKAAVIGTFVGLAFEWLPRVGRRRAAASSSPVGLGDHSYIRVRWRDLPPTDPVETWSELDAQRNEVRSVQIWADGRAGYASQEEEVGGARLSRGGVPTLSELTATGWVEGEPEVISKEEFERRWQAGTR